MSRSFLALAAGLALAAALLALAGCGGGGCADDCIAAPESAASSPSVGPVFCSLHPEHCQ